MTNELIKQYDNYCQQPIDLNQRNSDIWKLLPILHEYSKYYNHITEVGTRHGVSTHAFLMSLPQKLVCYDIGKTPEIFDIEAHAKLNGIQFEFYQQDILKSEIQETDFLFIDSWHTAGQCSRELELHSKKVKKRIAFHDVFTFWECGEASYEGANSNLDTRGLKYAIEPFLQNNKQWKEIFRTNENNGLLIIENNG